MKSIYFIDLVPGEQVREPEQSQNNYNLLKKIAAFTIIEKWSPADFFLSKQVQTAANNLKHGSGCACNCTWRPSVTRRCVPQQRSTDCFQTGPLIG